MRIFQTPSGRRIVQRHPKAHVACRGQGGMAAKCIGNLHGKPVCAMVTTEQGDGT